MSPRRGAALAALFVLLLIVAGYVAGPRRPAPLPARAVQERPTLLLLTSLPLLFGDDFALTGSAPAIDRISERYGVQPIAIADAPHLAGQRLLLMAHPRAQTAEALVALDAWVRQCGRVLLLADPALDWPSARPLGDRLRPPPGFADTGLLARWGVTLEAGPPGRAAVQVDGRAVTASSPGRLSSRSCAVSGDGLVARCAIGRGRATIVADADLLHPELSGDSAAANLDALLAELGRLER